MQKVLAMAVRTVMMKLMMVLMFSFFIVVMCLMVTQSGEKGYGRSEQVPVHDGVSLVLAGVISPGIRGGASLGGHRNTPDCRDGPLAVASLFRSFDG